MQTTDKSFETAVLGGGCFWCTEAALTGVQGVVGIVPGYCGGHTEAPNYEAVCTGTTGHIEVAQITFDPTRLPYADLLGLFFAMHDPTSLDRQGNDVGSQYRSAIFLQNAAQRQTAEDLIQQLNQQQTFGAPIVTVLLPPAPFWPAEAQHLDYFRRNPEQSYCRMVIAPKVAAMRRAHVRFYRK